ncbi:MAG: valine--tRNA ligase [Candidatus Parvarchaeota archaeon]
MTETTHNPPFIEKRWSARLEEDILTSWKEQNLYKFQKNSPNPVFSIDTPPPYINTPIHIGQAYTYTWMDAIARYKRMKGYNVLFPLGLDRNGLPIETQIEKQFKISILDTPRDQFILKARELLNKAGKESIDILYRLGHSYNEWEKKYDIGGSYETDDPEYRRLTQETFLRLYTQGLIYEGEKTSNYCLSCHTAISDAEVEYTEENTTLNYIKFKIGAQEDIVVATTRPELLPACKLIIFNPADTRYSSLSGKTAIVPIFNHQVKIVPHPSAKMDFGTGLVMICSYGDYTDIRILKEFNIKPTYVLDKNGRMNENAGPYKDLTVQEAKEKILIDLDKLGALVKSEKILHRKPICWRSKTPIEFIPTREIYLRQTDAKEKLVDIAKQMEFYSPESQILLLDWINSISSDWVLSRTRFYGTEIPLWYCKRCGETIVPEPGRYYIPWKEPPPVKKCPKCGGDEFRGEERILDTWFDSSSSQQYILGYLWDKNFFTKNYPCTLRPQGKEIVRSWLYFTLLKSYLLFGRAPFRHVWINYHVVDEKGEKMSKSLGNVIDPKQILTNYGAEAFRLWIFLEGNIAKGDIRYSKERLEGNAKFLTKILNIARLISYFPYSDTEPKTPTDVWIRSELNNTIAKVVHSFEHYDVNAAALSIRYFTWNIFADHYIEMVKTRAYGGPDISAEEQKSAWSSLHNVFKVILVLLAPILPFITDYIWTKMYTKESIHKQKYPDPGNVTDYLDRTDQILQFNSEIWNRKKASGLSLKDPVQVEIPRSLQPFSKDLVLMHRIQKTQS